MDVPETLATDPTHCIARIKAREAMSRASSRPVGLQRGGTRVRMLVMHTWWHVNTIGLAKRTRFKNNRLDAVLTSAHMLPSSVELGPHRQSLDRQLLPVWVPT